MLDMVQVDQIVGHAGRAALSELRFGGSQTAPTSDSGRRDALRFILVGNDLRQPPMSGDTAGDTILSAHQESELAADGKA